MPDSYRLKRDDTFLGKKLKFGETAHTTFVRLAKRGQQWSRPVHEVWDAHEPIDLTHPLSHESADTVHHFVAKLNNYTTRNAEHLHEEKISVTTWHLIAYPTGKFFHNYIVKQGFRDGTHGFVHAMMMSFHSFLTRAKLWLLINQ
jgi:hypothetical protein